MYNGDINTHIYRHSSVAILFFVQTAIAYVRLSRRLGSIPPFIRVLRILKSDVRFGTSTSFGGAMTTFQTRVISQASILICY